MLKIVCISYSTANVETCISFIHASTKVAKISTSHTNTTTVYQRFVWKLDKGYSELIDSKVLFKLIKLTYISQEIYVNQQGSIFLVLETSGI